MALFKRIVKAGNSYSIRLDKALLEMMDITEKTPLRVDVSTSGGNQIIITPIARESEQFNRAFERAFGELKEILPNMPDVPGARRRKSVSKKVGLAKIKEPAKSVRIPRKGRISKISNPR